RSRWGPDETWARATPFPRDISARTSPHTLSTRRGSSVRQKRREAEMPPQRPREFFSSSSLLRVTRAGSAVNPPVNSSGDVHDIAESGNGEKFGCHFTIRRSLSVHEDRLVLIRQKLRKLAVRRIARCIEGAGDVTVGTAKRGG